MFFIRSIPRNGYTYFPESLKTVLTPFEQKIVLLATLLFNTILIYIVYQCYFKSKKKIESFSSYSKGLYHVSAISHDQDFVTIELMLPQNFRQRILKKMKKFPNNPIISLNGVYAQIVEIESKKEHQDHFRIVTKIRHELLQKSALKNIQKGSQVSIAMASINPKKWLLDRKPIGTVIFKKGEIADGHRYREKLTFECSEDQYNQIKDRKYIGLNGSGFFIQSTHQQGKHYTFAVHAGRNTREISIFNRVKILEDTECTLTLPYTASL
jgi:hypothetical protein